MVQKLVLKNEVVKVKGRVKVITIKKEDFDKFLKLRKLRILDKEYYALMPPLDSLQKNTIDTNGLSVLIQQFMSLILFQANGQSQPPSAQMTLTTSNGIVTFSYTNNIGVNSQGVTVYMQLFEESGNYAFQYYYIGFDTSNDSYTTSQLELYVSASVYGTSPSNNTVPATYYTSLVRIAYTNTSFSKTSDSYLFIVWLIEFQNIPPYGLLFVPVLQNNESISMLTFYTTDFANYPSFNVYFNNGNCTFSCGGNCPSAGLGGFIVFPQNNSVILEFPLMNQLGVGISNLEILICSKTVYGTSLYNTFPISGSTSTTVSPPVSGATVYIALLTLSITYQTS